MSFSFTNSVECRPHPLLACGHPNDQRVYVLREVALRDGRTFLKIICPRCEAIQNNPASQVERLEKLFSVILRVSEEDRKAPPESPRGQDINYPGNRATYCLAGGEVTPHEKCQITFISKTENPLFTKITVARSAGQHPRIEVDFAPNNESIKMFFELHNIYLQNAEYVKGYFATKTPSDVLILAPIIIENNKFQIVWQKFFGAMMAETIPDE